MIAAASLSIAFFLFLLETSAFKRTLEASTVETFIHVSTGRRTSSLRFLIHRRTISLVPQRSFIFLEGDYNLPIWNSLMIFMIFQNLPFRGPSYCSETLRCYSSSSLTATPIVCEPISRPMILMFVLSPIWLSLSSVTFLCIVENRKLSIILKDYTS